MDQNQNNSSVISNKHFVQCILSCVLVFVVAFGTGVFSGPKVFTAKDPANVSVENTYEAGWNAAKKRLAESDLAPIINIQDSRSVRGSIDAISDGRISVRIRPLEPLADPALDTRVILTSSTTRVLRLDQKNIQEFQKELGVFFENIRKNKTPKGPTTPPEPFIKTMITVNDLKIGDRIVVLASEDIKVAKEFAATEIQIEGARTVSQASADSKSR